MKALNLDALDGLRHTVERGGVGYAVRPITARITYLIDAANDAPGIDKMRAFGDVVAAIVPDMPRPVVDDLSIPQMLAIINLASTQVELVNEAADVPNVARPAAAQTEPAPGLTSALVATT